MQPDGTLSTFSHKTTLDPMPTSHGNRLLAFVLRLTKILAFQQQPKPAACLLFVMDYIVVRRAWVREAYCCPLILTGLTLLWA